MTALTPERKASVDHRFFVGMYLKFDDPACIAAREYKAAYLSLEREYPALEAQRVDILAAHEQNKVGEKAP